MDIGERLKMLRGDKNRDKVAEELGISSSALGMYESNNRIPRDAIKKRIADFYGVSVQQIFFDQECHLK